jgi:hypothetical protein
MPFISIGQNLGVYQNHPKWRPDNRKQMDNDNTVIKKES